MAGHNSILPNDYGTPAEVKDAIGVTKFLSDTNWVQIIGGLVIQGGIKSAVGAGVTVTISLNAAVEKQILGIFCQPKSGNTDGWFIQAITLSSFDLVNGATGVRDFYWWAIGV